MKDEIAPRLSKPLAVPPSTRQLTADGTTALGQQITAIFMNLISTPDTRKVRIEECLSALMDTLFAHADQVSTSDGLQALLLNLVGRAFDTSTAKGCRVFEVVFDGQWRDQHEKRTRCLRLLLARALASTTQPDCQAICDSIREVLEENNRSTTDMITEHLRVVSENMRSAATPTARAAACEVLTTMVVTCASVIKRIPSQLEVLTDTCPPLGLLREAVEASTVWYRNATVRLLAEITERNCYEVTSTLANQVVGTVMQLMRGAQEEAQIAGLLAIIARIVLTPAYVQASWDCRLVCDFLSERDWSVFSLETRVAAVLATGRALPRLFARYKELYDRLANCLALYVSHDVQDVVVEGLNVIRELLDSPMGLRYVDGCVGAIRDCIHKMPHIPLIYPILEKLRARYGESSLQPIYHIVDEFMNMDDALVNYGKLNALLRFSGSRADLTKAEFMKLRIDLSLSRPEPVLIRSMPLLTTLHRTSQLNDVMGLLVHDSVEVRRGAMVTTVQLSELIIAENEAEEARTRGSASASNGVADRLDRSSASGSFSGSSSRGGSPMLVADARIQHLDSRVKCAVERILDVAVADRDAELRHEALHLLTPVFYPYLCLPDNLEALFMARSNTDRGYRDESLALLCRLHPYHPAIVYPQLLRTQEYMLRDVEAQDSSISLAIYKAGLMQMCAEHDSLLIEPGVIERVVLQRLRVQPFVSKRFSIAMLQLLRAILDHSGPAHHSEAAAFLQPILHITSDCDSGHCRLAALDALRAVLTTLSVTDTDALAEIYRAVARIIRWEEAEYEHVTVAAMRVLGTLGAVNPVKLRKILRVLGTDGIEEEEEVVTPALAQYKPRLRQHPSMADLYPSVVLFYLVRALQTSIDPKQQSETLVAVRSMLQEVPGHQRAVLLSRLLSQLQSWLRDPERTHLYEQSLLLMDDLAALLRQFKERLPSATGHEILLTVQQFSALPQAAQKPLSTYVVQLLDDLAKGLPAQEMRDHRWSVEFIHQRLSQNKNDLDLVQRVVKSLESFLAVMHEKDIQLILPHVVQCIEPAKTTPLQHRQQMKDINDACFDFLNYVTVKQLSLVKDCCAMITHTIMWYIELSDSQEEMDMGLHTLASMLSALKKPGERFIRQVERVAEQNGYPVGHFVNLVRTVSAGTRPHAPLSSQDHLNADLPLQLVSHLPRLGRREFETEMRDTLRIGEANFTTLDVSHPAGQTVIGFRFLPTPDRQACFNYFMRKALDTKSTLRRNLGILKIEQSAEMSRPVNTEIIDIIAEIPSAKSQKREQTWISWVHNTSVLLLKHSPYAALRCSSAVADRNGDLARDLFPFAAVAIASNLAPPDRTRLMDALSRAVEVSPYDTKQSLFTLAEFMEAERGKQKVRLVKTQRQTVFTVIREAPDMKFGINYDQDPTRGVVVTKVAPNGLGALAGVPVGGQLLAINGQPVRTVTDIRNIIDGVTRIDLTIAHTVEERQRREPKVLMSIDVLARVAFTSQMHAKAIYFNEVLYEQLNAEVSDAANRKDATLCRTLEVTERLIEFYGRLNLSQSANGLVKMTSRRFSESITAPEQLGFDEIGTLEQMHWWAEALRRYQARIANAEQNNASDPQAFVGALRCEEALGHMSRVKDMIDAYWGRLSANARQDVAPYRAKAAFSMGAWGEFDTIAADSSLREHFGMVEHCAALFRLGKYDKLLEYTQASREAMLDSFSESFNESYNRAYDALVDLQHLTHFEELVSFVRSNADRRAMLQRLWNRRLSQLSNRPANWSTMVAINSLVLTPREDLSAQVMAIRSLLKMQWNSLAGQMLTRLLGPNPSMHYLSEQSPELIHAYSKYYYITRNRREAYTLLKTILESVEVPGDGQDTEKWGLCWLLLGKWTMSLFPDNGEEAIDELLRATELSPNNSAAFHSLGILHYDLSRDPMTLQEVQVDHHVSAIIALFKSVQLRSDYSNSSVMQEVLLILSIWFGHSAVAELNEAVNQGIQILPDHVWLHVIPQLIARIGITTKLARAILADLLVRVGTTYPHALIYPLTVAEKSPDAIRRLMAERVLAGIRVTNDQMVQEASLISNEMVRIAILWTEKWHAAIQQAAYKPDNASAIMKIFAPLFEELETASTPSERNFEKTFGQALKRARTALQEKALDKSWTFLKQVYAHLSKMLGERRLYMSDVSPVLEGVRDSIVAVPGTFVHSRPLITIQKFHPRVYVMPSKQKPRRFGLDASDGKTYRFLLKGHEDMRQDERVMQFIGLIDTIFLSDHAASAIGLTLPQYAVIPLTDDVGIIGWVENTETIYKMLETYRQDHGSSIYEEVNMIIKKGGLRDIEEYHRLPKPQRKALLSYAMDNTPDNELRCIMWERNDTCEQWLGYRDTYGHTLAAMSMVGYVLGLGDRHLNNLMLEGSGTVVHIDFGDCFEVAMHRALYAEAVPFRLTRLLVASLGITGVDGVYRLTSELVMKNLRRHSENLLAILEAFIYDPLINWRLTVNENERSSTKADGQESGVGVAGAQGSTNQPPSVLADVSKSPVREPTLQLSKSFAKHTHPPHPTIPMPLTVEGGDEEIRNQQGDMALARVHAKLTGQDFSITNNSFSMARSSRRVEDDARFMQVSMGHSWASTNSGMGFGESTKDAAGAPLLTTYLSLRALTGGADCLDVPQQVDRLIREATSLENLSDAYLTGWAPFW